MDESIMQQAHGLPVRSYICIGRKSPKLQTNVPESVPALGIGVTKASTSDPRIESSQLGVVAVEDAIELEQLTGASV